MKRTLAFGLAALFLLSACGQGRGGGRREVETGNVPSPADVTKNPFGVSLGQLPLDQRVAVARALGVSYLRAGATVGQAGKPCPDCSALARAGLRPVLTVVNRGTAAKGSSTPPTDLEAYKQALAALMDTGKPALLVIENEEDTRQYFEGTPEQYGEMLGAACEVAHQRSTPCTNGGLLSGHVTYAVYQHYIDAGQADMARSFADRAFEDFQKQKLGSSAGETAIKQAAGLVSRFLEADKRAEADYVNFHWYIEDKNALAEAVAFIEETTGLPAISNEIGQRTESPDDTRLLMQAVVDLKLKFAVWFGNDARLARGLVDVDGSLRSTGVAFRDFLIHHYGRG